MGFKKGNPGRPKGSRNKNTVEIQAITRNSTALAASELVALKNMSKNTPPAVKNTEPVSNPVLDKTSPEALEGEFIEGVHPGKITPKQVMLSAMREAWDEKAARGREAGEVEDRAFQMQADALLLSPETGEKTDAFKARVATALAAASEVHKQAAEIRANASKALDRALQCAAMAAPFEHAKLAQTQQSVDHTVNITIRQF